MNKLEISQATTRLCQKYNREMSSALLESMLEDFQSWDPDEFARCVENHRSDPDRGRFFPTLADMNYQVRGDRAQAKELAAEAFDLNPQIDGTSKFDADRENYERREKRKRAWITRAAYEFEGQDPHGETPLITGPRQGLRRVGGTDGNR